MNKIIPGIALAAILFAAYLLVYRGSFTGSPDEYLLFDSTESFANRGNFNITYLNNREFDPQMIALTAGRPVSLKNHPVTQRIEAGKAPWRTAWYEPLYPLVAAPFFWLAKQTDTFGLVHAVYLTNIFITIGTALLLYGGALHLGYNVKTAWVTGLLFGVASNAYPFTQYNLREPLTGFLTLACFITAFSLQRTWHLKKLVLLCIFFAAALATKVTTSFILPGLLLAMMPLLRQVVNYRRVLAIMAILALAAAIYWLWLSHLEGSRDRLNIPYVQFLMSQNRWGYVLKALLGYQFSLGRSIWLYSPVLLLGVPYAYKAIKQGERRFTFIIALTLLIASMGYGLTRAEHWAGGTLAYGPRYMLFLLPVMFLWLAPAVDDLFKRAKPLYLHAAVGIVISFSVFVQVIGLLYHSTRYFNAIFGPGVRVWEVEGSPSITQSQPYINLRFFLDGVTPDIAWLERAAPGWIVPFFSLLALLLSIFLIYCVFRGIIHESRSPQRDENPTPAPPHNPQGVLAQWGGNQREGSLLSTQSSALSTIFRRASLSRHEAWLFGGLLLVLMIGGAWGTLYSLRHDPVFSQGREDIPALLSELNRQARQEDIIFIASLNFVEPFMNTFRAGTLAVKIQDSPGERHSPDDMPLLVSDNPAKLLGPGAKLTIDWAAKHYDRMWVVMPYGPFVNYALRPEEHYMAEHYFPIRRIEESQFARAILFDTHRVPAGNPQIQLGIPFDDGLLLSGLDILTGTVYHAGDVIPVSLVWQPYEQISFDYNVSLHLFDLNGSSAAQYDGQPQGTFGYMSRWEPGQIYRDNYGFQLPEVLPAGTYTLRIFVYNWQSGQQLSITSPPPKQDSSILAQITIQSEH